MRYIKFMMLETNITAFDKAVFSIAFSTDNISFKKNCTQTPMKVIINANLKTFKEMVISDMLNI